MRFFQQYWPSIMVLAVILYATLYPNPVDMDEMPMIPHLDKIIHAVMMGGLVGAIAFDRQRADRSRMLSTRFMTAVAAAVMTFGVLDEIAQWQMAVGRSGDVLDLVADWVGVWTAYFVAPPVVRKVLRIKKEH